MVLLAPTAAIVAGALALPTLLLFYLLKLRRRPVRVSATVFWRQAERDLQANVPLRWLRASWLFALHALILALFVLALGRPAARIGAGSGPRLIIAIDRSASMGATDMGDGRSRLDEAKRLAREIVDEGVGGFSGRVGTVVTFAARANAVTRASASKGLLKAEIDATTPTDQAGDLNDLAELLRALAAPEGEEDSRERPEVVVISDGSFESMSEGSDPPSVPGARVRFVPVTPRDAPGNIGIASMAARRDLSNPGSVRVFARLVSADIEARTIAAALSLNGSVIARRAVEVSARASTPQGRGAPGEGVLTFDVEAPEGGVVTLELGREDALACDNSASVVVLPAATPAILLVRAATPERESAADWILLDALTELRPRALTAASPEQYAAMVTTGEDRAYDLVVFDRVDPGAAPRQSSLSLGAGLAALGVARGRAGEGGDAIVVWSREHPILRHLALDTIIMGEAWRLGWMDVARGVRGAASGAGEAARADGPSTIELARGRFGPVMSLTTSGRTRHLAVAFPLADSNWPLHVSFPVFLASAVDALTLREESDAGHAWSTSEAVVIDAGGRREGERSDRAADRVALVGPVRVEAAVAPGASGANFGLMERAGVYRVEGLAPGQWVAVNLCDEFESALGASPDLGFAGGAGRGGSDRGWRELWPWFVAAGFALLMVEWIAYAASMRA